MYVAQRSLMYFPDRVRTPPPVAGLPGTDEVELRSADGETLVAWYRPPQGERPIVLYFQGNAGSLAYRVDRFRAFAGDGLGLLALSYRGYGGSTAPDRGRVDRRRRGRLRLCRQPLRAGADRGLGRVARHRRRRCGRRAPSRRRASCWNRRSPRRPTSAHGLLVLAGAEPDEGPFRSDQRIAKVTAPLLVLHGAFDRVVPIELGEQLFALANEPKQFARFPQGTHADLDEHGALAAFRAFLAKPPAGP